jgi:hypothetical protein
MTTFTDFSNILPDPQNPIDSAGAPTTDESSTIGGISSIKIKSKSENMSSRTNSGRLITSGVGKHSWEFDLSYNNMTRDDFEPVQSFILHKKGRFSPFYFSMPSSKFTRNLVFGAAATIISINVKTPVISVTDLRPGQEYKVVGTTGATNWSSIGAPTAPNPNDIFTATSVPASGDGTIQATYIPAGTDSFICGSNSYTPSTSGTPLPGDFFVLEDSLDPLHTKLYRVSRVETSTNQQTGAVTLTTNEVRVHFTPSLRRHTYANAYTNFVDPKPRVFLSSDVQEYSTNIDNLYSFSLKLEEAEK